MDYQQQLAADLRLRRASLQKEMQKLNIEACVLSTSVNLFYMAGLIFNGYYYLPAEGEPIHFVKRPNGVRLDDVVYIRKPEQITEEIQKRGISMPQSVLIEVDILPFSDVSRLMGALQLNSQPANASVLMRKVRSVKSPFELEQVRKCAAIHAKVYNEIPALYRKGMNDIEFQIEIERVMRLNGSMGIFRSYGINMDIFMGSLLTGDNGGVPSPFDFALGGAGTSPFLPLGASGNPIREGQSILVDMAGNYSPWMTDMSRVFAVGKLPELAYRAHQVSLQIQAEVEAMAKPGVACADLYNKAIALVEQEKLEAYFMGTKQQAKFIGHGVGLEINEPPVLTPRSKELLEPGIVFALEPKFVIPEVGPVGIENTFIVTSDGVEKATVCNEAIQQLG